MVELVKTTALGNWLDRLRDRRGKARILDRIERLAMGHRGEDSPWPGYRVYFMERGPLLIALLCGGDKGPQNRDIERAKLLAAQWRD
jgi:putative component of toxin-antitoxin plasmid stabilization module